MACSFGLVRGRAHEYTKKKHIQMENRANGAQMEHTNTFFVRLLNDKPNHRPYDGVEKKEFPKT